MRNRLNFILPLKSWTLINFLQDKKVEIFYSKVKAHEFDDIFPPFSLHCASQRYEKSSIGFDLLISPQLFHKLLR